MNSRIIFCSLLFLLLSSFVSAYPETLSGKWISYYSSERSESGRSESGSVNWNPKNNMINLNVNGTDHYYEWDSNHIVPENNIFRMTFKNFNVINVNHYLYLNNMAMKITLAGNVVFTCNYETNYHNGRLSFRLNDNPDFDRDLKTIMRSGMEILKNPYTLNLDAYDQMLLNSLLF